MFSTPPLPFRQPARPLEERIDDLVARLEPAEKIGQLMHDNPPVTRLGLPAYNWWNEACHGVGRNGCATVFPQTIGLGATFDRDLVHRIGDAIALEARAKHVQRVSTRGPDTHQYEGLTFWTPNINLFRDPRWGRGQETFGEDPFLTGELGVALVRGLQGTDPHRLKVAACAKHFAVHSGPERLRHGFDARCGARDLRESYLPHFERLVRAGVEAVMGAYNRTNGEACCASPALQRVLRDEWGFRGHFVSDCGAVDDFHRGHGLTPGPVESAALALRHGCDLNCGCTYNDLHEALRRGLVAMADIDRALRRLLRTKFRLGLFDPPGRDGFAAVSPAVINGPAHRTLAREAARRSIVLLKNNGLLPLRPDLARAMVVGPSAASVDALLGNYFGLNPQLVTLLEGITARAPAGLRLGYATGCGAGGDDGFSAGAVYECSGAELTIAVLGTLPMQEGEEGDAFASRLAGDRAAIELPAGQRALLEALRANGKPVVLILTGGGAIACPEAHAWCDAILQVWYPGCEGGHAVADVLWGDAEPGGRLPVTVPRATTDLPPFEDYAMAGRTYRFATAEPLYPFGYGLGYTTWSIDGVTCIGHASATAGVRLQVSLRNTGRRPGRTILQLYLTPPGSASGPRLTLAGFAAVELPPGAAGELEFVLEPDAWRTFDDAGGRHHAAGDWLAQAALAAPTPRSLELGVAPPASIVIPVA